MFAVLAMVPPQSQDAGCSRGACRSTPLHPAHSQVLLALHAVIAIKVWFSTQHGGRHTFRLCPRPAADKACFEETVLQR